MPAITVAITAYNLEKYITRCMEELLAQTFHDFEIIVYDDCSKDHTRQMLLEMQSAYPQKIRTILGETPLRRPARARNAILDSGLIRGTYLVFLDGDDNIEPDFLESLYTAAEKHQADVTFCAYDRFEDETGHVICKEAANFPEVLEFGAKECPNLAFVNASLWNKLIRTDIIKDLRLPDFQVGEDASFLLALYTHSKKIAYTGKILIHYRVRTASVISNTPEETVYQFAEEIFRLYQTAPTQWLRDSISLAAFIHIGISMPFRLYDNPTAGFDELLAWITRYFAEQYGWFENAAWRHGSQLIRYGVRGIGIMTVFWCYHLHCFRLFLKIYRFFTSRFHFDIKF